MKTDFKSIEEYISTFPNEVKERLEEIRKLVKKEAPEAVESISYGMPTFKLNGKPLVYFAGYEHHIGFYPIPSGIEAFKKELSIYKQGKGSVQFPLNQPLPTELIEKIVKFRVQENKEGNKK